MSSTQVYRNKIDPSPNMCNTYIFKEHAPNNAPESTTTEDIRSYSSLCNIKEGQLYDNRLELKTKLHMYAMRNNFEFEVSKSGKNIWCTQCIDDKCYWRLCAMKLEQSTMFEVWKFVSNHICSSEVRHEDHRLAVP